MGSYTNFKNFGPDTSLPDGNGGKPGVNYLLARQSSVYSLTFDELQNTFGGPGKDFGSMNMDDLLKSIWTAEETQGMTSTTSGGNGNTPGGNLQRQGSVTLPRTVSQKTVDEVWRDAFKDVNVGVEDGRGSGGSNLGQRQPTLGEVTLEEFLARAGVVREDIQPTGRPNAGGIYGGLPQSSGNNTGLPIRFQLPSASQRVIDNQLAEINNTVLSSSSLGMNIGGVRSSQQQFQNPQPQVPPLFPKQTTLNFSSPAQTGNNGQLAIPGTKGFVGMSNPSMNNSVVRGGAMIMSGPCGGATAVAGGSPGNNLASDTISKSTVDTSSLSPSPVAFGEGGRGRRSTGSLEKVVERRHRRMIKNRESAARSRARKQAYTLELEAEIAKLRELNQELQKKQAEIVEMQKNQILETANTPLGGKRRCLRRTLTGPW